MLLPQRDDRVVPSGSGTMDNTLTRIVDFLVSIGIPTAACELAGDTFLPAVCIQAGGLVYDPHRLRWPGDLLHEAGHIAVTPAELRAALNDALDDAAAAPEAGEVEAIAWSWAALVHLGLAPEVLFHAEGYKGRSEQLKLTYSLGVFPGVAGLARCGMTASGPFAEPGVARYPAMQRWLR